MSCTCIFYIHAHLMHTAHIYIYTHICTYILHSTHTFNYILLQVMEVFQPEAIVVCGGADSLSGDRLGCFNLSLEGHADCMEFLAKFGVPLLILGGGGFSRMLIIQNTK